MSLLNDALKDLDQSKPETKTPGPKARYARPHKASFKKLALPAVAVFAALVWLTVEMDILGLMPVAPVPPKPIAISRQWLDVDPATLQSAGDTSASTDQTPPEASTEASASAAIMSEPAAQASAVASSMPAPQPSSSDGDAVTRLLDRADAALQKDRLLLPREDNAFQWYQSVLVLDPDNVAALAGIDQIQQRYLQWAQDASDAGRAERYLSLAQQAGASATRIAAYRRAIPSAETSTPKRPPSDTKRSANFDKDLDLAQRLRTFPLIQYENKAWLHIRNDEESRWTVMALADAYAGQGNAAQLQTLFRHTRSAEPAVASYVEAQWRIVGGDLAGAVPLLDGHRTTLSDNQYHLRLLAGVHASAKDYGQALPLYRQLTQRPDFNHNDWLGYAIALDRVGEQSAALQAYRKISRVRHSDARVHDFVHARISDLSAAGYQ